MSKPIPQSADEALNVDISAMTSEGYQISAVHIPLLKRQHTSRSLIFRLTASTHNLDLKSTIDCKKAIEKILEA